MTIGLFFLPSIFNFGSVLLTILRMFRWLIRDVVLIDYIINDIGLLLQHLLSCKCSIFNIFSFFLFIINFLFLPHLFLIITFFLPIIFKMHFLRFNRLLCPTCDNLSSLFLISSVFLSDHFASLFMFLTPLIFNFHIKIWTQFIINLLGFKNSFH